MFNRKFCGNGVPDWAAIHDEVNTINTWKFPYLLMAPRDVKVWIFFKRSFRYENVDEKLKTERSFMKTIAFIKSFFF